MQLEFGPRQRIKFEVSGSGSEPESARCPAPEFSQGISEGQRKLGASQSGLDINSTSAYFSHL